MSTQLSLLWEQEGLLEFMSDPRTLPELTAHLAGPPELTEHGFHTWAYTERWCVMQGRAWSAVCSLQRDGRIERIQPSPLDTPLWQAKPDNAHEKGTLTMLNPIPTTAIEPEA